MIIDEEEKGEKFDDFLEENNKKLEENKKSIKEKEDLIA